MAYTGDKKREYQRNWLKNKRDNWLLNNGPCNTCGTWDNLELHHVIKKDPSLSKGVGNAIFSMQKDKRDIELDKCIVLCKECHRIVTIDQQGFNRCGTKSGYNKGCRCNDCREAQRFAMQRYRQSH